MEGKRFFTNSEIRDLNLPRKCEASKDDVEIDDQPSMFVFVEGLNVINGPKCNKVLNVITFCPKCNNNLP